MGRDLLLVIDMQNVYAEGGCWYCPKAGHAGEKIKDILEKSSEHLEVIFTAFVAPEEPEGVWAAYNQENHQVNQDDYANEIMDIFSADLKKYPLYKKSTYSSLSIPEVQEAARRADRVILTGVVAECCILSTAMALIDQGSYVIYLTDACAGINEETERAVEKVLEGLEPLHVKRMTTEEYLQDKLKKENEKNE